MATLIGYIYTQLTGRVLSMMNLTAICVVFTVVTGYIAYRGVTGSTVTAIWINIIQWITLIIFYRPGHMVPARESAACGAMGI